MQRVGTLLPPSPSLGPSMCVSHLRNTAIVRPPPLPRDAPKAQFLSKLVPSPPECEGGMSQSGNRDSSRVACKQSKGQKVELTFQGEGGVALHSGHVLRVLNSGRVLPDPGGIVAWQDRESMSNPGRLAWRRTRT